MRKRLLNIGAILTFVFLFLPALQSSFHWFAIKPLKGAFVKNVKPVLNSANWWDGIYQDSIEQYLKENIGFYEDFVRLYNQLNYSFFDEVNAKDIVKGKDNQFMDIRNIHEYTGANHVSNAHLDRKMFQLKKLQDTLEKEGQPLLLILEPTKSRIYPELIPDWFLSGKQNSSNYDRLVKDMDSLGIKYLDLNTYFISIKDSAKWPLFSDLSFHWSTYGMVRGLDTIIGFTNNYSNIRLKHFTIDSVEVDDNYRIYVEYDIGNAMNLLCEIPQKPLAYPQLSFHGDTLNENKPSALFVADSYFFNIRLSDITNNLFSSHEFWYYFRTRYSGKNENENLVLDSGIQNEIKRFDIIYLMQAELTYNDFGWGFIETLYNAYFPDDTETRYEYYIRQILKNPDWIGKAKKEAFEMNFSDEEAIRQNAISMLIKEFNQSKSIFIDDYYIYYDQIIKGDSSWLASVKWKADKKNISVDEMIKLDAEWIFYRDHPDLKKK